MKLSCTVLSTKVSSDDGLNRKKTCLVSKSEIEEATFVWFKQQRIQGAPISSALVKAKAESLAVMIAVAQGVECEFKASDGWLWRWQKRHGVKQLTIVGEQQSVDAVAVSTYLPALKKLIADGRFVEE